MEKACLVCKHARNVHKETTQLQQQQSGRTLLLQKLNSMVGTKPLVFFGAGGVCPQKNKTVGEGGFFHQWYGPPLVPQGVLSSNQCCVEFSSNFNSFFQIICILIEKLWFRF